MQNGAFLEAVTHVYETYSYINFLKYTLDTCYLRESAINFVDLVSPCTVASDLESGPFKANTASYTHVQTKTYSNNVMFTVLDAMI